jgi:hypothetical protein
MQLTAKEVQMLLRLIDNRTARAERQHKANLRRGRMGMGADADLVLVAYLGILREKLMANTTPLNPLSLDETLGLGALDFKRRAVAAVRTMRGLGPEASQGPLSAVLLLLQCMPERADAVDVASSMETTT